MSDGQPSAAVSTPVSVQSDENGGAAILRRPPSVPAPLEGRFYETRPLVTVVQDGARLHYAVPRALQRAGALDRIFVEWYSKPDLLTSMVVSIVKAINAGAGARMSRRVHPEIDPNRVITNPQLAYREAQARRRFDTPEEYYAWVSELVGRWVIRKGWGRSNGIFGFVRNISPTLCRRARNLGLAVVADQMIAPMVEERRQAGIQAERFPDWRQSAEPCNEAVVEDVERRTWKIADHLTCGSTYVGDSLIAAGVSPEKISVMPYPIDSGDFAMVDRTGRTGPMTVGAVGSVGLRKGTPYFLQVAKRLPSVQFYLVGPLSVDPGLLTGIPNVNVVGPAVRDAVPEYLARFDALLFPSTCEGSPGAVMEAMASGLPVITSPTSGTVVRHGVEGFVHPYDDIDGLAGSVEKLASDVTFRLDMGRAARRRAEEFSLDRYADDLTGIFRRILTPQR